MNGAQLSPPTTVDLAQQMPQMWQYGVLGVVVVVFALVIKFLYKRNEEKNALLLSKVEAKEAEVSKERSEFGKEREGWAAERARWDAREASIRHEFEERHTELVKTYATQILKLQDESRIREDAIRKEALDTSRQIGEAAARANDSLTQLLQKFYERMVSHTPRGY